MTTDEPSALGNAWKLHDAQLQWTSQVDSKASFVLAIETALMAGVMALAGDGRRLSALDDAWTRRSFVAGVAFIVLGLVVVALCVRPRLRNPNIEAESKVDYIYFGHVRRWDAESLSNELARNEMTQVVTRQVVRMAEIAWRKHRYLQVSITSAMIGTLLVSLAAWTN
jgi:hypothetical protein